jgi:hypothetical protein
MPEFSSIWLTDAEVPAAQHLAHVMKRHITTRLYEVFSV